MVIELRGRRYRIERLSLRVRWLKLWSEPNKSASAAFVCFFAGVALGLVPDGLLFGTQLRGPAWAMWLIPVGVGLLVAVLLFPGEKFVRRQIRNGSIEPEVRTR